MALRLEHPRLVRIERRRGYRAARTPMDHPLAEVVAAAVQRSAAGPIVRLPSMGGSLPLYLFQEPLELPVIVVPIANHDNNQHGPNENLRIRNFRDGVAMHAALLSGLGAAWD